MSSVAILGIFLVVMMALALIRVPLAIAILGGAFVGFMASGRSLGIVAPSAFSAIDVFAFLAVPGFIYAGALMLHGRIAESILDLFQGLANRLQGALGAITVVVSMLFGTISGSSVATVSMVGGMMIPELEKRGYRRERAAALVAATGVLGVLIPPSIPGIMYAIAAGQSIAAVWLTTVMPAFLLGSLWAIIAILQGRGKNALPSGLEAAVAAPERGKLWRSVPALFAPVIIFGGIYGGVFTPTEGGAVVVVYCLIIGFLFYRGLRPGTIFGITAQAARMSAAILLLIVAAAVAGRLFTLTGLPRDLTASIVGMNLDPLMFLLVLNLILLGIGMFMETNTAILILTPILLPIAQGLGVDPLHFGAIMLLNLELGMITPPMAGNLFVACKVAGVPFNAMLRPLMPYYLAAIPVLAITTYWPGFSLALARLF